MKKISTKDLDKAKANINNTNEANAKKTKEGKKKETQRQKKLTKLILENLGNKKPKTMYQMMLDSGYADSTAKEQSQILSRLDVDDSILDKLIEHRKKLLIVLDDKLKTASYADAYRATEALTKVIELLAGNPTDRTEFVLPDADKKKLDEILDDNS